MQWLESNTFVEDTRPIDIKIVLFLIACGLGYWSHFVVKFPEESYCLVIALSVYAVIMAIHYYIENYVEKEAFYISKANTVS